MRTIPRRPGGALARRNPWLYPSAIGLVIGALLAALTLRLVTRDPLASDAGSFALDAGAGRDGGSAKNGGASNVAGDARATADGAAATSGTAGGTTSHTPPATGGAGRVGATAGGDAASASVSGDSTAGTDSTSPPNVTASDVGVTATTIRLGFVLLDLGGASAFGAAVPGFDPKVQQQQWQTFVDDINKRGGIRGRKIQAFYAKADPVDTNSQRKACLQLTQDNKVFMVVNAASALGTSTLCVTAENHTLLFTAQMDPTEYFQKSGGLLISTQQHGNRWFSDWAAALHHINALKGKTLGVLTDQDRADLMVKGGLVPTLKRLGYQVAYLADVSGDPSRGPSEIPAQLQQMRLKGVDAVFLATNFVNATAFVNDADKQQWRPQYFTSDWSGDNVGTLLAGMPQSFDGAIGITDYEFTPPSDAHPLPPEEKACADKWNALTGQHTTPDDGQEFANRVGTCLVMNFVEAALGGAGVNPTRASVSTTVQGMGGFPLGGLGGRFGPGKLDYAEVVRPVIWGNPVGSTSAGNCNPNKTKCWNEHGPSFDPE